MAEDGFEVRVFGFAELQTGARGLASKIERDAGRALEDRAASQAAQVVRSRLPRLTGALAGSVVTGSDRVGSAFVGLGGEGVPYAGWIEFGGTRGRPYAPSGRYLFPTATDAEPQIVAAASDAASKTIGGYSWPTPRTS